MICCTKNYSNIVDICIIIFNTETKEQTYIIDTEQNIKDFIDTFNIRLITPIQAFQKDYFTYKKVDKNKIEKWS